MHQHKTLSYMSDTIKENLAVSFNHGWSNLPGDFAEAGLQDVVVDIVSSDQVLETREPQTWCSVEGIFGWGGKVAKIWSEEEMRRLRREVERVSVLFFFSFGDFRGMRVSLTNYHGVGDCRRSVQSLRNPLYSGLQQVIQDSRRTIDGQAYEPTRESIRSFPTAAFVDNSILRSPALNEPKKIVQCRRQFPYERRMHHALSLQSCKVLN